MFFNLFNLLISKNNFQKIKKYYFNIFLNKKYIKKPTKITPTRASYVESRDSKTLCGFLKPGF